MKNILFLHSSSELYGSDWSLFNIVGGIDKSNYNVHVILPCDGPLVKIMNSLESVQVHIYEVAVLRRKNLSLLGGISYLKEFFASIAYLQKFVKKHEIDLIDTNTSVVFPGAVLAKIKRIPSIWHIREIIKSNVENKFISFMMHHFSDLIIANSNSTGSALEVSQEQIRVVYNGTSSKQKGQFHTKEKETLVIGMAGRINRWKGQKLFVDMAESVHQKYPNVEFLIAGEAYAGEEMLREELKTYITDKGLSNSITLLGQVDDMNSFYSQIDIFVLPSIQPEPFGLVILEAMEYSIPVVATNHGGPVEIINNGIDGYLVNYESCEQMANIIEKLVEDRELRLEIGINGKERRNYFSVDAMVKGVTSVFEELLF